MQSRAVAVATSELDAHADERLLIFLGFVDKGVPCGASRCDAWLLRVDGRFLVRLSVHLRGAPGERLTAWFSTLVLEEGCPC